jgi:hypothetical protein
MSGSKLSRRLAEAWARVRAEAPKEGEKPKEFGPPPRQNAESKPFRMPADPFAQLRGGADSQPEARAQDNETEDDPVSSERATNGVHREDAGESWILLAGWPDECDGGSGS